MLKTDFTFRRFLDTFVPGFILVISTWYLYKPYFNKYFPTIAFDSSTESDLFSSEIKLAVLLVASIFVGILINHFSDISVALLYPNYYNEKRKRTLKRFAVASFSLLSFDYNDDPRVSSVHRYLTSNRKDIFQKMLKEWAYTDIDKVENTEEAIIAHQHICTRVRTLNLFTEKLFNNCLAEVSFSASILMSLMMLFPITLLLLLLNCLFTSIFPDINFSIKFIDNWVLILILIIEYILMILMTFSLKRRFRHFSSQILTLSIHIFMEH